MLLTLRGERADARLLSLWPQRVWALLGKDVRRQIADVSDLYKCVYILLHFH